MSRKFLSSALFAKEHQDEYLQEEDFQKLLDEIPDTIKEDKVVKGQVIKVTKDFIIVDVGLKNESRIPIEEFELDGSDTYPVVGDKVDVYVGRIEDSGGRTILSRAKAIREEAWERLKLAYENGEKVEGIIFGKVKGGLTVDLAGIVAFLPGSQVDVKPIKDPTSLMGFKQLFHILKMDEKYKNIIISRRAIVDESRVDARDAMLSTISEGMLIKGTVKNITDYGAFVDLGNVDGLLHVTDISWRRVNHPSELLSIGDEIEVKIIKYNPENCRISLGLKQLDNNPWLEIQKTCTVGQKMKGKITNVTTYGVFIEVEDGIEGLVPNNEVAWMKSSTKKQNQQFPIIGQEVDFMILNIDTEKHRISLSIKQCQDNHLMQFAENYPVGSVVTGSVSKIVDFGLFITLEDSIEGMVHISDISWNDENNNLDGYNVGDTLDCKVLSIDLTRERVKLGIKQLTQNPHNIIEEGSEVLVTIDEINDDELIVSIDDDKKGIIKKEEIGSKKAEQVTSGFTIKDKVDAVVLSLPEDGRIILSINGLKNKQSKKTLNNTADDIADGNLEEDSNSSLSDALGPKINDSE
ncbi:MAG: 30S ribosomal protein S1 [Rickettsiaceae bacterium]